MDVRKESFVVVGLGNPGDKYARTRHNLGWLVVEAFAARLGLTFKEDKEFKARVAKGNVGGKTLILVLPLTYMNMSGEAVSAVVRFYKLLACDLVVVMDDASLSFGQMRLRERGSSGGHNGLKSIEACLGTDQYPRLKLGIGLNGPRIDLSDYVLSGFSKEEQEELAGFEKRAVEVLEKLLTTECEKVMNQVNPAIKCVRAGEKKDEKRAEEKPL